jgi:hypothetical protein
MIATYHKARRDLLNQLDWGRFRLSFLVAILFYNWTESALRALDPIYFLFYLIAMDYSKPQPGAAEQSLETGSSEEQMEKRLNGTSTDTGCPTSAGCATSKETKSEPADQK